MLIIIKILIVFSTSHKASVKTFSKQIIYNPNNKYTRI